RQGPEAHEHAAVALEDEHPTARHEKTEAQREGRREAHRAEHVEVPGAIEHVECFTRNHPGGRDDQVLRVELTRDHADRPVASDTSTPPGRTMSAPGTVRCSMEASNRSRYARGSPGSRIWYGRSSNSSIPSVLTPMIQCSGASRDGPP